MYKHKAMRVLSQMIRSNEVDAAIDIRKAIKLYENHTRIPTTKFPKYAYPRFYSRAQTANSRAKKHHATGIITANDLESIFKQYSGQCTTCHTRNHLVFDHIKPYYRGGTNTVDNIQLLCRMCNMEKGVSES